MPPVKTRMPRSRSSFRRLGPLGALAWLAGAADGLLSIIATSSLRRRQEARRRFVQRWHFWMRRMIAAETKEPLPDMPAETALVPLRRQLVGKSRGAVVSLLGPPPATGEQPHPDARVPYWHADTWYYPGKAGRPAMAITFEKDIARSIDPLSGPR